MIELGAAAISVAGTLSGLLVGYWISLKTEERKRKHEVETGYRKEILKHIDDIIKPLYHSIMELWGSIGALELVMKSETLRNKAAQLTYEIDTVEEKTKELRNHQVMMFSLFL